MRKSFHDLPVKTLLILILFWVTPLVAQESLRTIGEGKWQFLPDGIALPKAHQKNVQDYHGVAVDSRGRVYIAYYSSKQNPETRTLARFNYTPEESPPFKFDRFLGDASWVAGRVHGLNIIKNNDGEERLLLVYNSHKVILCDLDGNIDKTESWSVKHRQLGKASDGNRSPLSKHLGVYDGYKSNILHELHIHDGSPTGHMHGGRGSGFDKTSTAHGIGVDIEGRYVVADRGNKRLVWQDPDFTPIKSTKHPGQQLQLSTPGLEVCNVQFLPDGSAVIPSLNAKIGFLKKSDKSECGYEMDEVITMPNDLIKIGYDGIHDANFSNDKKYLIVAVWQRTRSIPPRLFVLKKVSGN
ncbi:MAG: hypothetical protein ACPIA7_09685 [Akkermansiaceae bacterium]